jgi:ABC-type transport system substrate-binding protein
MTSRHLFASLTLVLVAAFGIQAQDKKAKKADDAKDAEEHPLIAAPSMVGNIPIWQLKPFDRLHLKNDQKTIIDVEPDRLPKDIDLKNVEEGKWCGKMGLPWPGTQFPREIWYRFTSSSEGRKYEVVGKGIAKIEHYEDIIFEVLKSELTKDEDKIKTVKFDDCLEMLRILHERQPGNPRNVQARIRFHAVEAKAAEDKQDWERGFVALMEERALHPLLPANAKQPEWIRALDPIEKRISDLCDHWTNFLVNLRKFEDGRRVIARLELLFPNHDVGKKWRRTYDERVKPIVARAEQLLASNFYVEALATLDGAVEVQPDHPGMRATMDKIFAKHSRLRVAVGELPGFHSGPAGWSPADVRAADLLHEPLMRVKGTKEGVTEFDSRIIDHVDVADLNRRASLYLLDGLSWPDGKRVTPVDVQRVFADARQPNGIFYHPALEFLLTNVQSQPPNLVTLEFDRPQFQAKAWLQFPFLRMGLEGGDVAGGQTVGWVGMGPFVARERRPDRIMYLANAHYLRKGRPVVKQIVEIKYPTPEERIRAIQTGQVDIVDNVPFRSLPYLKTLPGVKQVKIATPKVGLLQLNFDREALRLPTLRRALVYAIDRAAVLQRIGAGEDKDVKLLTGPLPYGVFGYNLKTEPWPYQPFLAKTLTAVAAKELKALPPLTFAHQGNESTRLACEEIAKQLRAAGFQITLMEVDERAPDPRDADIRYQTLTVSDPIFDLITTVTRDNPSLVAHAGPRLRQYMIELLQTPNVTVASGLLPEIHQTLRDEIALIPLWQWNETCLVADSVVGAPTPLARNYQDLADWKAVPRYPPAHWTTKPLAASKPARERDLIATRTEVRP